MKQMPDAEIHLLRVFAQVVEAGGLSAAQERLNVAPSTISTQIFSLEERLGFRICLRGRAGFSLTPKGKIVLEESRKLFGHFDAEGYDRLIIGGKCDRNNAAMGDGRNYQLTGNSG